MKSHGLLPSHAIKCLAVLLPVAITAVAVAEVRESGTIRKRRMRPNQPTANDSATPKIVNHMVRTAPAAAVPTGRTRIMDVTYDDSTPYLQPVPTQSAEQSDIQLVGFQAGRSRRSNQAHTHTHNHQPVRKKSGGLFGRLFGKKTTVVTETVKPPEDDNTVYIPHDHTAALRQYEQKEKQNAAKVAQPHVHQHVQQPVVQQQIVQPQTPNGTYRAVPPSMYPVGDQVDAITQTRPMQAPASFPAPVPAPPAADPAPVAQSTPQSVAERLTTPLQKNPIFFDDPFSEVSEAQADGRGIPQPAPQLQVVETPVVDEVPSPFPVDDDFVIEEIVVEERVAEQVIEESPKWQTPKYDVDPILSPYTGVKLGDKPFEVKSGKPRRFPGVAASASRKPMSRQQMMKLVSSRNDSIGLKGFCPVSLLDRRRLTDTNPEFKARFGLKTYYFSTADARNKFEQNPTRYLPVAGGNDVVRLAATDEEVKGKLDHAAWYRGRLYLFESAETRRVFFERPTEYVNLF